MDKNKYFLNVKEKAILKLNNAINIKRIDKEIEEIIHIINKFDYFFTSSSCSGRIVLIELPEIGDKRGARFLGKWHCHISGHDIDLALKRTKQGMLWLLAQSPILHVIAETNLVADKLLKIAISSGFKNSGLKSAIGKIVVEICSTERLDSPVGYNGILYCNKKYLNFLIDISNKILDRSKHKLIKFEQKLNESMKIK